MKREYSLLWYCLGGGNRYLIWYTDEKDGVVIDTNGKVPRYRVDETYIKVGKTCKYLYRAVDKEGNTIEFMFSATCSR